MLTIGDKFPNFSVTAVVTANDTIAFQTVSTTTASGKWKVFFFYPKDFTFVCPTEISGFDDLNSEFEARDCQLYGGSTDNPYVHMAWRKDHPDLKDLSYPLLSDLDRSLSGQLGILDKTEGVCLRATFIVDPDDIIRYVAVNDLGVGRSPEEVLRVLDGLQNGGLIPCNWKKGEDVLQDETARVA